VISPAVFGRQRLSFRGGDVAEVLPAMHRAVQPFHAQLHRMGELLTSVSDS